MTTKWDDLVEAAADTVPVHTAERRRRIADRALRALLAKGIKFVPGEATDEMMVAFWRGNAGFRQGVNDALSAGSIKPEGE